MATFEQRTGIGKPPRRRQKPVAAPKGPKPTKQRKSPPHVAAPSSQAIARHRGYKVPKGTPAAKVPHRYFPPKPKKLKKLTKAQRVAHAIPPAVYQGLTKAERVAYTPPPIILSARQRERKQLTKRIAHDTAQLGFQPKLAKLGAAEAAREAIAGRGYTPSKYGKRVVPKSPTASVIQSLTGLDVTSASNPLPDSPAQYLLNAALIAAPGLSELKAAEAARAGVAAVKEGRTLAEATKVAKDAAVAARGERFAQGARARGFSDVPATTAERTAARKATVTAAKARTAEQVARVARHPEFTAARTGQRLKAIAKETGRKVKATPKKVLSPPSSSGRTVSALSGTHEGSGVLAGLALPAKAHLSSGIIGSELSALKDNPSQTLHTTARVAEQFPAAAITPLSALVSSVGTLSTKPLVAFGKQATDYVNLYLGLAGPHGTQIAENKLGLIPAATAALAIRAIEKPIADRMVGAPKELSGKVRKQLGRARDPHLSRTQRAAALKEAESLSKQNESRRSAHGGRKLAAVGKGSATSNLEARLHRTGIGNFTKKMEEASRHDVIPKQVSEADLVHYLGPRGWMGHDHAWVLDQIHKEMKRLGPLKKDLAPLALHDRIIGMAILKNPKVLDSPRLTELRNHGQAIDEVTSVERHSEGTGTRQTTPSPEHEAVKRRPIARLEGIPLNHETAPHELRGMRTPNGKPIADAQGRLIGSRGQPLRNVVDADRVLRAKANSYLRAAKALEERAKGARGKPKAGQLRVKAAGYRKTAERILAVTDRYRRAKSLRIQASQIEQGFAQGDAKALRAEADNLEKNAQAADRQRRGEFISRVDERIAAKPYSQPFYVPETPSGAKGAQITDYAGARQVAKEKFSKGVLAREGTAEHSGATYLENILSTQRGASERNRARQFLAQFAVKVDGKRILTSSELNKALEEGKLPSDGQAVEISRFAPTVQRTPGLRAERDAAGIRAIAAQRGIKGPTKEPTRLYFYVRSKAAIKEYDAQTLPNQDFKVLRTINRVQATGMLATSPVWFTLQLAASPIWLAYSHANPVDWGIAVKDLREMRKNAPADVTAGMEGIMGATRSGTGISQYTIESVKGADPVGATEKAFRMATDTPVGRFGHAVLNNLKRGGPLIQGNARFEAQVRGIGGLMNVDGLLRDISNKNVQRFAGHVTELSDELARQAAELRKQPMSQRATWLVDHPEFHAEFQARLERALGSWNHLSSKERGLQAATIFYPFVRASVRWFLWTAPLHTPLRYALIANLAQSNNVVMDKLTKGTGQRNYLTQYGAVPIYGPGAGFKGSGVTGAINLYRVAPGANTLLEAAGGGTGAILGPLQPLVKDAVNYIFGKDQYGRDLKTKSLSANIAQDVAGLNPIGRLFLPKSSASKLFAAVSKAPTGLETFNPLSSRLIVDLKAQTQYNLLSKTYTKALSYSHTQLSADTAAAATLPTAQRNKAIKAANKKYQASAKAWTEVDKWYKRYKIKKDGPTDKQVKAAFSYLGQVQAPPSHYGSSAYGGGNYGSSSAYK